MQYDAVIFDLDGTLLNTLTDLCDSVNEYLRTHGFPERTTKEIRDYLGNGAKELIRLSLPGPVSDEELEEALRAYKAIYRKNMANTTRPYDGILPMLRRLRDAGVKTAVVSNKPNESVVPLSRQMFPDLLDAAVGDMPDVPRKPDPAAVLDVIEELGVPEDRVLYVGDSEVDVRTAKNGHLTSGAVTWGFRDRDVLLREAPDYLIDSPAQLSDIVLKSTAPETS